jgi:hypothetical protein
MKNNKIKICFVVTASETNYEQLGNKQDSVFLRMKLSLQNLSQDFIIYICIAKYLIPKIDKVYSSLQDLVKWIARSSHGK